MIICGPLPAPLLGWRTVYFMLASIKVSTFKENVVHNFLLTTIKFDCFTLLRLHTDGMVGGGDSPVSPLVSAGDSSWVVTRWWPGLASFMVS